MGRQSRIRQSSSSKGKAEMREEGQRSVDRGRARQGRVKRDIAGLGSAGRRESRLGRSWRGEAG